MTRGAPTDMRILHVSTRLILGGSQENTILSCEGQARLGHEVHLAFGPILGPEGSMLQRVEAFNTRAARGRERTSAGISATPIATHLVPTLVREIAPVRDARARRDLRRLIARLGPDVVHTHSSKAGILGRLAASALRRRSGWRGAIVHTVHGPPFMPAEGGALRRLRTRALNDLYARGERVAAARCDLIISVADAMTEQFLRRGIGRPERFVTVRSGIDTGPYLAAAPGESRDDARRSLGLAPGHFVVGTVARLAEHKGHDDLLTALAAPLRDGRMKMLWVGDGWWRARLLRRARDSLGLRVRELDLGDPADAAGQDAAIIVTGLVPPERVPMMLRAMDVLAHPSYREGLPRTVPQALLAGVCPVAYDVDGTREACVDGVTGRLIPAGDTDALRRAIEGLYSDPAERARLADAGRARCIEEFSAERMIADLERVYARALAMARGA